MSFDSGELIVQLEGSTLHSVILQAGRLTIGRTPDNEVALPDWHVSRHHAEIRLGPDGLVLIDLGSTGGTLINGTRILAHQPHILADGAIIQIGPFVLIYQAMPAKAHPVGEPPPSETSEPIDEEEETRISLSNDSNIIAQYIQEWLIKRKRLEFLLKRSARLGHYTDAPTTVEIKKIQKKIRYIKDMLRLYGVLATDEPNDAREFILLNQDTQDNLAHTHIHTEIIDLLLEGNIKNFNPTEQQYFKYKLAKALNINIDDIKIIDIKPGSIKITIELPEEAIRLLIEMFLKKDPRIETLNIKEILSERVFNVIESQITTTITNDDKSYNNLNRKEDTEIDELEQELDHQIKLVKEQKRRLRFLELQKARSGANVDATTVAEIEDIQSSIDDCRKKIDALKLKLQQSGTSRS